MKAMIAGQRRNRPPILANREGKPATTIEIEKPAAGSFPIREQFSSRFQ